MNNIWFNYTDNNRGDKNNGNVIPIIMHYNTIGEKLANGYKRILKEDNFFKDYKLLTAYKNPRNLYKSLIRSKLT